MNWWWEGKIGVEEGRGGVEKGSSLLSRSVCCKLSCACGRGGD